MNENMQTVCNHRPSTIALICTRRGYRVRCLRCGMTGPERPEPVRAYDALLEQVGYRRDREN